MSILTSEQRKQTFEGALEIEEQLAELLALRAKANAAFDAQAERLRVTHKYVMAAAVTGQGADPGQPVVSPKPKRTRARKEKPAETPPPAETGEKRAPPEASARTATAQQAEAPVATAPALEVPAPQVPCANCHCGHSVADHTAPDAVTLQACHAPGCPCQAFELGEVQGWKVTWGDAEGVPGGARVFTLSRTDGRAPPRGPLFLHGRRLVAVKGATDVLAAAEKRGRWPGAFDGNGVHVNALRLIASTLVQQAKATPPPAPTPPAKKATRQRKAQQEQAPASEPVTQEDTPCTCDGCGEEYPASKLLPVGEDTQRGYYCATCQKEIAETSEPAASQAVPPAPQEATPPPAQLDLGVPPPPEEAQPTPAPVAEPTRVEVEGWRVELGHAAKELTCVWLVNDFAKDKYAFTWFGGEVGELVAGHPEKKSPAQQLTTQEAEAKNFLRYKAKTVVRPLEEACRQGKVPGLLLGAPTSGNSGPYRYALSGRWQLHVWKPRENEPHAAFTPPGGAAEGHFRLEGGFLLGAGVTEAQWADAHQPLLAEAEDLAARGFLPELKAVPRG